MNLSDTIALLGRLTAAHGVSGDEGEVRDLIASLAEPYCDTLRQDVMGNLIAHKRGDGPKLMLAAHMDSVGLVATHIDKEGFVRFGSLGGLSALDLLGQRFRFRSGACGVCMVQEDKEEKPSKNDLYLDIGAADEAEARALVQAGDTAACLSPLTRVGAHRVSGSCLDNRAGCLVLLQAMARIRHPANDLYFVFTVQEEVGTRGVRPAAFAVEPDYGLVVDVTCPDDVPGARHEGTTQLGKGAAVKVMDRSVICHPRMVERLRALAQEQEIPFQSDLLSCGGTDGGPMRASRAGVVTGGVSVPCRYTHTAGELCDLRDIDACVRLVTALCERRLETI